MGDELEGRGVWIAVGAAGIAHRGGQGIEERSHAVHRRAVLEGVGAGLAQASLGATGSRSAFAA